MLQHTFLQLSVLLLCNVLRVVRATADLPDSLCVTGAMAAVLQRHASLAKLHGQAHLVTPGGSSSPSAKEVSPCRVQDSIYMQSAVCMLSQKDQITCWLEFALPLQGIST